MTQRIFDIENEKDMSDLWDIVPDEIYKIRKGEGDSELGNTFFFKNVHISTVLISINWHDKTEITRPIQEATEQDIGKLCVFYDDINDSKHGTSYGILEKINTERGDFKYLKFNCLYKHCRRLTKQEIEELC